MRTIKETKEWLKAPSGITKGSAIGWIGLMALAGCLYVILEVFT